MNLHALRREVGGSRGLDLRRSFEVLAGVMAAVLLVLCALSVALVWHGARRVEPLRKEVEALASAQSQLVELMAEQERLQAPLSVGEPGAAEQGRRGIMAAFERLSPRVDASLGRLARAQADSQELNKVVTSGIGLLLLALALLALIASRARTTVLIRSRASTPSCARYSSATTSW